MRALEDHHGSALQACHVRPLTARARTPLLEIKGLNINSVFGVQILANFMTKALHVKVLVVAFNINNEFIWDIVLIHLSTAHCRGDWQPLLATAFCSVGCWVKFWRKSAELGDYDAAQKESELLFLLRKWNKSCSQFITLANRQLNEWMEWKYFYPLESSRGGNLTEDSRSLSTGSNTVYGKYKFWRGQALTIPVRQVLPIFLTILWSAVHSDIQIITSNLTMLLTAPLTYQINHLKNA